MLTNFQFPLVDLYSALPYNITNLVMFCGEK